MITIDKNSKESLYYQIYQSIKEDILEEKIPAGDRLLGTRTLANMLEVSRNTVDKAYSQLIIEGYIESKEKSGYYVLALPKILSITSRNHKEEEQINTKKIDYPQIIYNLTNSSHTSNLFPKRIWKKHYHFALDYLEQTEELSKLHSFQGDYSLRKEISLYLQRIRGISCHPNQIIITSGLQQSIDYLCQFLKNKTGHVIMEEPSYPKARAVFKKNNYQITTSHVDEHGLNIEKLPTLDSDFIYTTPSHHFPLGMVLPISRRYHLLNYAQKHDTYIIEDDYDSELRYYEKPIPALKSIDTINRVIYLGTFSKILSPSFRMSYMVLPDNLAEGFISHFYSYNSTVNLLNQVTLANIFKSGDYDKMVRKMNHTFKKRFEAFKKGFQSFNIKIKLSTNMTGQYFLVTFPEQINQNLMIDKALKLGVRVYDTMQFWQDKADCPDNSLFLGFSQIELEDIDDCIERLRMACDN